MFAASQGFRNILPDVFGGIKTVVGDYAYITFNTSTNLVIAGSQPLDFDYLIIAGGGAGGYDKGAGGGAGGVARGSWTLNPGSYAITVGAGGPANGGVSGSNGSNSVFASIPTTSPVTEANKIAYGGGRGGRVPSNATARVGGNGGSGGGNTPTQFAQSGSLATSAQLGGGAVNVVQGYRGGDGAYDQNTVRQGGGGGGGAGGQGEAGGYNSFYGTHRGGAGGAGYTWFDGVARAGGGGGGSTGTLYTGYQFNSQLGSGTAGGGNGVSSGNGGNGQENTGGGGGGTVVSSGSLGGSGGSGVVILRYKLV